MKSNDWNNAHYSIKLLDLENLLFEPELLRNYLALEFEMFATIFL